MGLAVDLVTLMQTLAENESVRKSRPSGSNVDGTATSKVERGQVEEPSVGLKSRCRVTMYSSLIVRIGSTYIPGPAGDWAIHDGSPAKREDHGGKNATTLEGSTNDKLYGTCTEEHLVQAENNFWQERRSRGRCRHDVFETKVCHVTDEGTGGTGVGEGISPEHPLEAYTKHCWHYFLR